MEEDLTTKDMKKGENLKKKSIAGQIQLDSATTNPQILLTRIWKGGPLKKMPEIRTFDYIYLLIEFQSTVDHFMALRMASYVFQFHQEIVETTKCTSLQPVFPILVYNGDDH